MTEPMTRQTDLSPHAARYEALRRSAIESHHACAARDGLAVLLRQGMAAWLDAWSNVPMHAVQAVQDERERPPLPDAASAEVVHILATMALGHIEEVHA